VVDAGSDVRALVGRMVAARSPLGMYAQYRVIKASDCLVLPEGISARQGASAIINPLTVLAWSKQWRREGHSAWSTLQPLPMLGRCLTESVSWTGSRW